MAINGNGRYVNTTKACAIFAFLLTGGFIWATFHKEAPFIAYMEGLVIGLSAIIGKRLAQKWQGKKRGFTNGAKPDKDNDDIPIR